MHPFLKPEYQFYILFLLALLLLRLPKVGKFFRVINTLYHENGHAFASLITGGRTHRIDLFADTSGACITADSGPVSRFITLLSGYPAGALASYGMFYLLLNHQSELLLYILSSILLFNLLFWVRNKYGLIWLLLILSLCGIAMYINHSYFTFYFLFSLAALNLTEALWSCVYLIYLSLENPYQAGDAYALRQLTFIPAFIWAMLFFLFSVWVAALCVKMLWHFDMINYFL
jgi:hypothetical protein